jgi:folate-binding protein YgfZ
VNFVSKLNFYNLRAKVIAEDLSEILGVLAVWGGATTSTYGLCFADPRVATLGLRAMIPPHLAGDAAAKFGATLVDAAEYEAHRIALGVPRGGSDFIYGDAFPHESDMDQLAGVDFDKGCYVGQEVVSRMQHRGSARTRIVGVTFDGFAPDAGTPVTASEKSLGTLGSSANGHGIALLRLDRVSDALAAGGGIAAGGVPLRVVRPAWAKFDFSGAAKVAE